MNLFEAKPGRAVLVLMTVPDPYTGIPRTLWEPAEVVSRNFYNPSVCVEFIHSAEGLQMQVDCEEQFELPLLKPMEEKNSDPG